MKKDYEPDFNPEGDMVNINSSKFTQDFQLFPIEELLRGVFYNTTHRSLIFVGRHETIEDIVNTCIHETIHGLIEEEREEDERLLVDMEQEHWVIRQMAWANESLVD